MQSEQQSIKQLADNLPKHQRHGEGRRNLSGLKETKQTYDN